MILGSKNSATDFSSLGNIAAKYWKEMSMSRKRLINNCCVTGRKSHPPSTIEACKGAFCLFIKWNITIQSNIFDGIVEFIQEGYFVIQNVPNKFIMANVGRYFVDFVLCNQDDIFVKRMG